MSAAKPSRVNRVLATTSGGLSVAAVLFMYEYFVTKDEFNKHNHEAVQMHNYVTREEFTAFQAEVARSKTALWQNISQLKTNR